MFVDQLYTKSEVNGKFIKIVYIAPGDDAANQFLKTNPNCGVICNIAIGGLVFIAENKDLGEENGK